MEIERKFTIKQLPEKLSQYEYKKIEQGYLCTEPVIRIRKSNDSYILCYKSKKKIKDKGAAIVNEEVELPLTKDAYYHLREKTDGHLITKTRYIIPLDARLKIELDVFEGNLKGLVFAEVEFPDEESAKAFKSPEWFLKDVSFDKRFHNNYLSTVNSLEDLNLNPVDNQGFLVQ